MLQDVEGTCWPVFQAMDDNRHRLSRAVATKITLEDPEAQSLLDRHFQIGSARSIIDALHPISSAYRLTPDDGPAGARAWWALQHAAFVVQKDLLALATYAKRLEEENRSLRQRPKS